MSELFCQSRRRSLVCNALAAGLAGERDVTAGAGARAGGDSMSLDDAAVERCPFGYYPPGSERRCALSECHTGAHQYQPSPMERDQAAELARLREALTFYANEDNWGDKPCKHQYCPQWGCSVMDGDNWGDTARAALATPAPGGAAAHQHQWQPVGFTPCPKCGGAAPTERCACGSFRFHEDDAEIIAPGGAAAATEEPA